MRSVWVAVLSSLLLLYGCATALTPAAAVQVRAPVPPGSARSPDPPLSVDPEGRLTQRGFADELAAALERERPGYTAVNNGDEIVELWAGDTPGVTLPVGPAFAEYQKDPANRRAIVAQAVQGALDLYAAAASWDQGRNRFLPRLIPQDRYLQLQQSGALPVDVPFSDDIHMIFEVRLNGASFVVHKGLQVAWNQPSSVLYAQALTNLDAATPPLTRDANGIWRFAVDDDYGVVRLLLVSRFTEASAQMISPLVVAIPAYDRLYAFEVTDPDLVERMHLQTQVDFTRASEPFSTQWLMLSGSRFVVYGAGQG